MSGKVRNQKLRGLAHKTQALTRAKQSMSPPGVWYVQRAQKKWFWCPTKRRNMHQPQSCTATSLPPHCAVVIAPSSRRGRRVSDVGWRRDRSRFERNCGRLEANQRRGQRVCEGGGRVPTAIGWRQRRCSRDFFVGEKLNLHFVESF